MFSAGSGLPPRLGGMQGSSTGLQARSPTVPSLSRNDRSVVGDAGFDAQTPSFHFPPATAPAASTNSDLTFPALTSTADAPARPNAVNFVGNPQRLANMAYRPSRLNPALAGRRRDGPAPPAGVLGRGAVSLPTSPIMRNIQFSPTSAGLPQWTALPTHTSDPVQTAVDPLITPPNGQLEPYHSPSVVHDVFPPDTALQQWSNPSSAAHSQPSSPTARHSTAYGHKPDSPSPGLYTAQAGPSAAPFERGYEGYALNYEQAQHPEASQYRSTYGESSYGVRPSYADERRDSDMAAEDGPARKKRQQVRVACTHCQKACKKCSNTRPCERCVKYGFKDCIDSSRKPRKTGVKRGPYKRRPSNKFGEGSSTDFLGQPVFGRYAQYDTPAHSRKPENQPGSYHAQQQVAEPSYQLPSLNGDDAALRRMPLINPFQRDAQSYQDSGPSRQKGGLESALAALQSSSAPRWVDGQRVSGDHASVPFGEADQAGPSKLGEGSGLGGGVPFPLKTEPGRGRPRGTGQQSLGRARPSGVLGLNLGGGLGMGYDPFSRAVSPIRETPTTAALRPRFDVDLPLSSALPSQYASPITAPLYSSSHDGSAPNFGSAPLPDRARSTVDPQAHLPMKALKRIHRPSLRTLISPGISREPSPVDGDPGAPRPVDDVPAFMGTPINHNTSGLPTFFAEQISPAEQDFPHRPCEFAAAGEDLTGLRSYVRDQMRRRPGDESPVLFQGDEAGSSLDMLLSVHWGRVG